MREEKRISMRKRIGSLLILSAGILLLLLGMAGLVLPIIPGFALILLGLWMISKVYQSPLLERILEYVKRKKDSIIKEYSERRTTES